MEIKDRLREIRLKASLSEVQLAFKMGVSRTTIGKIEKGQMNPALPTLLSWLEHTDHFLGVFPQEAELLSTFSGLKPSDQLIVAQLIGILPHLSEEHREMYAVIFNALSEQFKP